MVLAVVAHGRIDAPDIPKDFFRMPVIHAVSKLTIIFNRFEKYEP
ncbi:hypothetical protein [Paraburkholderia solisilvae]|nr:hypothetical protein [Paraburkholderia solisilvae]